jgi:hypothetical protein
VISVGEFFAFYEKKLAPILEGKNAFKKNLVLIPQINRIGNLIMYLLLHKNKLDFNFNFNIKINPNSNLVIGIGNNH